MLFTASCTTPTADMLVNHHQQQAHPNPDKRVGGSRPQDGIGWDGIGWDGKSTLARAFVTAHI
eukprot:3096507-Rhodomonas_salina.7